MSRTVNVKAKNLKEGILKHISKDLDEFIENNDVYDFEHIKVEIVFYPKE